MSTWEDLKIVSFNLGDGPAEKKVRDLRALFWTDVICLQEASDRGSEIASFLAEFDYWRQFKGTGKGGQDAVPILYNTRVCRRIKARSISETPRTYVGPRGAGPTVLKAKWLTTIEFQHKRAGRRFTVLNHHLLPSVQRRGISEAERRNRREVYAKQVDTFMDAARGAGPMVFGAGDWNAEWTYGQLAPVRRAGFRVGNTKPTHGKRRIDLLLYKPSEVCRKQFEATLDMSSDHRVPVVLYRIKGSK